MNNIPAKHKNIFLFLAIACFAGIILIFVFDGYMGLYDTLTMTSGERSQIISPEQWENIDSYVFPASLYADNAGVLSLIYEIDNRRFSSYKADIGVSIWKNQEKVSDIINAPVDVNIFSKQAIEWKIDTRALVTDNITIDHQFTLEIDRGDTLRKVFLHVSIPQKIYIPAPATEVIQ